MSVRDLPRRITSALDHFLFRPDTDVRVGELFRIALALQLAFEFVLLAPSWIRYYGDPPISEHYYPNLFTVSNSPLYLYGLLCLALMACLTLGFGVYSRTSALLLYLIQRSMVVQSPVLVNGHDYVFTVLLLCSIGMPLGAAPPSDSTRLTPRTLFSSMCARRVAQLLFVLMYLSTGIAKPLDDIRWRDGTALAWITLSNRWSSFSESTLLTTPIVSIFLTYFTLVVEILAPALIWFSRLRLPMILAMCSLHLGIILLMDSCILLFNSGSMTWALLFAKDEDLNTLGRWLRAASLRCRCLIKK